MSNDPAATSALVTPDVALGRRDHLFLVGGAQRVLEHVLGQVQVRPGIMRIFKENIENRRLVCDGLGARYCHIVCPDKHSVLTEEFPFEVKVFVGNSFKHRFGDLFVYPVEALRCGPDEDSYWKTDTHWNMRGKLVFVRETLKALGFGSESVEPTLAGIDEHLVIEPNFSGDLGSKLSPKRDESGIILRRPEFLHVFSNNVSGSNGTFIISLNPTLASGRLLMFCDSFAISCLEIFSLFFREILIVRSAFFHTELAREFKPTHVVSSNVERYLPSIPTDQEAPVALLLPQLLGKTPAPDARFYEALNAQLRVGTPMYRRFHESLAGQSV
jgi:hypothetical protein